MERNKTRKIFGFHQEAETPLSLHNDVCVLNCRFTLKCGNLRIFPSELGQELNLRERSRTGAEFGVGAN